MFILLVVGILILHQLLTLDRYFIKGSVKTEMFNALEIVSAVLELVSG